jgi:hypothetical protein
MTPRCPHCHEPLNPASHPPTTELRTGAETYVVYCLATERHVVRTGSSLRPLGRRVRRSGRRVVVRIRGMLW